MKDLEQVQDGLVELWGRLAPFWGVAPTTARVHGWLLGRDEPADGQAIAEGLGTSRGAVSMACRELIDWGLVLSERPAGSRRVLYRAETDLERAIRGIVATRKRREWDPLLESLAHWRSTLSKDRSRPVAELRRRLSELEGVVSLADRAATSFLKGGLLPRLGLRAMVATAGRRRDR